MVPGRQPFWGISSLSPVPGGHLLACGSLRDRSGAQGGFVARQCLAPKGRAKWKELVGIVRLLPFALLAACHCWFLSPQNDKCSLLPAQCGTLRSALVAVEPSSVASYKSTLWAASPENKHFLWIFLNLVFLSGLYLKLEGKTFVKVPFSQPVLKLVTLYCDFISLDFILKMGLG